MQVLVTGGAGYIGSQMTRQLLAQNIDVVVADSLENGHRAAVPQNATLQVGNIGEPQFLEQIFARGPFDAVMHFAGYIEMKESMENPGKYFRNNAAYSNQLLDAMVKANVKRFVFSSSAGVYGNPVHVPIPESDPTIPTNPYGQSKLMVEQILHWYDDVFGMRSIALRYFNAAGATLDGRYGEDHPGESHIIPLALRAAMTGTPFKLFGDDYPTPDGTCVRDYVHVVDLCDAHLLALDALMNGHGSTVYNVGIGRGYSNKEILDAVRRISGLNLTVMVSPRRPGDANESVADTSHLRQEFGWTPRYSELDTIIGTAWKWHQSHPRGYGDRE